MKRVALDAAAEAVRSFVQSLPMDPGGVALELQGRVLCTVIPPEGFSGLEKAELLRRGRELVRRSRNRNEGVPIRTIEREIRGAVDEVRRRKGP
jgi:hypothetical protein